MDPNRLGEWVTIHRALKRADRGPTAVGFRMDQQLHLRGVSVEVQWELVECEPFTRAVWHGKGPARSSALTEYQLHASDGECTRFDYRNEFRAPLGPIGSIASRALVGGMPKREAERTLQRLKTLVEGEMP